MEEINSFRKKSMLWLSGYDDIVKEYECDDLDNILCGSDFNLPITEDFDITIWALKFLEEEFLEYEMDETVKLKTSRILDKGRLEKICNIFSECKEKLPEVYEEVVYDDRLENHLYDMFTDEVPRYLDGKITLEEVSENLKDRETKWRTDSELKEKLKEDKEKEKQELIEKNKRGRIEEFLSDNPDICLKEKLSDDIYIVYESEYSKDRSCTFEKGFTDLNGVTHKMYYENYGSVTFSKDRLHDNRDYTSLVIRENGIWNLKHHNSKFSIYDNLLYVHYSIYDDVRDLYVFNKKECIGLRNVVDIFTYGETIILSHNNKTLIIEYKYNKLDVEVKIENSISYYCGEDFNKVFFEENFFNLKEIERIRDGVECQ